MTNTLLLVNPIAGKTAIRSFLLPLLNSLTEKRRVEVLCLGEKTNIGDYLNGKEEVICCGGDGTLNSTINAILNSGMESDITVGYIPCGSTNDFARSAGIPLEIPSAIQAVVTGKVSSIDVGIWNNCKAFSYIASFGAFSNISYSTPQNMKNSFGHFAYVLNGLADIGKITSIPVQVTTPGNTIIEDEYCFGGVANSTSIAGIVKLDKCHVDMSDGLFEVLLIKKPKNLIELNSILTAISTGTFSSSLITFFKCSECVFEFKREVDWTLDGEREPGQKRVEIRNEKRKIKIILPTNALRK